MEVVRVHGEGTTLSVKHLLHKYEDPRLIPRNQRRTIALLVCACNPKSVELEMGYPWTSLSG